ncbi:barstar family protein [Paenibacillus sp. SGZ-1009]|uniref:barstar family protein n=1 Tax=Paenibacillus campi TaxID=3106031 RepID=UPI002B000CE3|nr:barstar family protein [Paenibacillus sp. SGZ-1009]
MMKTVTIDGKDFHTKCELHEQLKEKLELPEFYGANLDALWDCITGMIELPLELHWLHYNVSEQRLGAQAQRVRALLEEAQNENIGFTFIVEDEAHV